MTRFPNFRSAGRLARYASTILTVSLLVTLKVEVPCSLQPPQVQGDRRAEAEDCRLDCLVHAERSRRPRTVAIRTCGQT